MQKERYQSQINQNFGTVCHTEVCLTFSRLATKLSEIIAKFRGCNLKIQHWTSFDLNGLKNSSAKYLKNCIKLLFFSKDWYDVYIYCWGASKLIQIFLPGMCECTATVFVSSISLHLFKLALFGINCNSAFLDLLPDTNLMQKLHLRLPFSQKYLEI